MIEIPLRAGGDPTRGDELEYKVRMVKDAERSSTNGRFVRDRQPKRILLRLPRPHAGIPGKEMIVATYKQATGANADGALSAPFDGVHGWFFQNRRLGKSCGRASEGQRLLRTDPSGRDRQRRRHYRQRAGGQSVSKAIRRFFMCLLLDEYVLLFWKQYMTAYEKCLGATSTSDAPWYVVPADDKENARLIVSQVVLDTLEKTQNDLSENRPQSAGRNCSRSASSSSNDSLSALAQKQTRLSTRKQARRRPVALVSEAAWSSGSKPSTRFVGADGGRQCSNLSKACRRT